MFSADITWTPLAEEPGLRQPVSPKGQENRSIKSRDNGSVKSEKSHKSTFRWPLSKKSRRHVGAIEVDVQRRGSSASSIAAQHGLIPYDGERAKSPNSEIIKRLRLREEQVRDSEISSEIAPTDNDVYELPAPVQSEFCTPLHPPPLYISRAPQQPDTLAHARSPTVTAVSAPSPTDPLLQLQKIWPDSEASATLMLHRNEADDTLSKHQPLNESKTYLSRKPIGDTTHELEKDLEFEEPYIYLHKIIRRMGQAPSVTIYHRMTEQWTGISEQDMNDVHTEKQLWALAAFHGKLTRKIQHSDTFRPDLLYSPSTKPPEARIFDLGSSLAEVYHLSAVQPSAQITWASLGPKQPSHIPVSPNVRILTQLTTEDTAFSLLDCSFDRIRSHFMPSIYPAAKLKTILEECYRLLVPGGVLELLLINPIPSANAGPSLQNWVDTNLTLKLERKYISTRPNVLLPMLCDEIGLSTGKETGNAAAGSDYGAQLDFSFPITVDCPTENFEDGVACEVGRHLYSSMWSSHLDHPPFWENVDILEECRERECEFQCTFLYAVKPSR